MPISNNKYYIASLKLILGAILLFLLFSFYSFSGIINKISVIPLIFMAYFEFVFAFMILISLFRRYEQCYTYFVVLSPVIATIASSYVLIKNMNTLEYLDISIIIIIIYSFFFIFTKYYVDIISLNLNQLIIEKDISNCIGDDYRCISIYTRNIDEEQFIFIQTILKNVLGYSKQKSKTILLDKNEYIIFEFTRKLSHSHLEHLVLIPIYCLDIGYQKWLDEGEISERPPITPLLTDIRSVDNQKNVVDYLGDSENVDVYNAFFIYQYFEDGDRLHQEQSFEGDVYLTFANLLVDHDRKIYRDENDSIIFDHIENEKRIVESFSILHKYLVTYYKKDNMDSHELIQLRDKLYSLHIEEKYKPLIDIVYEFIDKMLKKKHTKTIFYFSIMIAITVSIFHMISNSTTDLVQTLTVFFAIPAGIYSMVQLYDRFF